jgi:hypothetical protein
MGSYIIVAVHWLRDGVMYNEWFESMRQNTDYDAVAVGNCRSPNDYGQHTIIASVKGSDIASSQTVYRRQYQSVVDGALRCDYDRAAKMEVTDV